MTRRVLPVVLLTTVSLVLWAGREISRAFDIAAGRR